MTTKRALLIGINNYFSAAENCSNDKCPKRLHGCLNDVQMIKQLLEESFGFLPEYIEQLHDETEMKPTRENICSALQKLLYLFE